MSLEELRWLHAAAAHLRPRGVWVELGVWKGRSFLATALGLPSGAELVGVDTFAGSPESLVHGEAREPGNPVRQAFHRCLSLIRDLRPDLLLRCIEGDTVETSELFEPGSLDACFIDASHTYAAVRADLLAWAPRLRTGGLLAGHDSSWAGVAQALAEQPWTPEHGPGSLWRRPGGLLP